MDERTKLIEILLKQGRITLNESRVLAGLKTVNDPQFDKILKKSN